MNKDLKHESDWTRARNHLTRAVQGWMDPHEEASLTLPLADEDWLLEITSEGKLLCMAGYALEDMRSILCDGTTEDLGSDELAKQSKFYLQQTVSKHRAHLLAQGFTERMEMNDSFVAAHFERPIDLSRLEDLENQIHTCRTWFTSKS